MDMKTYFHIGKDLDEKIYMDQPKGFVVKVEEMVCIWLKTLYGLEQLPKMAYGV